MASLGALPSSSAISWVPVFTSDNPAISTAVSSVATTLVTPAVPPLVSPASSVVSGIVPSSPAAVGFPAGAYLGEGLLPVPEKLAQKILRLEFIEMRELMPETWLREEEEASKNTIAWPKRRSAPVTDILQWLQCYAAMVGVLSKAYPSMVPEFMSYQATIIKCARDFDGLAWAQYDRAYRRQVAQTKDLRWSRLNPTLYSLCFAGKAKRHIVCAFCLSDNHTTEQCPENPSSVANSMSWFNNSTLPGPSQAYYQERLCNLFNAVGGPRCNFHQCKFAHKCSACRGTHARAFCRKFPVAGGATVHSGSRVMKRPRME